MNKIALWTEIDRRNLFTQTGLRKGLPPFHVEKDFWVCWVLATLFGHQHLHNRLTFRGGTSLSKAWGLIERFSEDVDLAIARDQSDALPNPGEEGISSSQKDRCLKGLRDECRKMIVNTVVPVLQNAASTLPGDWGIEIEPLEKARDPFSVYFRYPGTGLIAPANYNTAHVKIELSGRGEGSPMSEKIIRPYVAEIFPTETGNPQFALSCVHPERTFWEKVALIHEQNVRPGEKPLGVRHARHLSDIVRLWNVGISQTEGFIPLFDGVKDHRRTYFDYTWVNYKTLALRDLKISPPDHKLAEWRADYEAMRAMFMNTPESFEEIVNRLKEIERVLSGM